MAASPVSSSDTFSRDLLVAGKVLGIYCQRQNIEWLRCKTDDQTNLPGTCLRQGEQVQACADEVYVSSLVLKRYTFFFKTKLTRVILICSFSFLCTSILLMILNPFFHIFMQISFSLSLSLSLSYRLIHRSSFLFNCKLR